MQDVKTGDVFASLRQFVRVRSKAETRCELCGAGIAPEHSHLLEANSRKVVCSCQPCAILFSSRAGANYYRIPSTTRFLADFNLQEAEWDALAIPINMAFFCLRNDAKVPVAYYPSPAGATESLLPMDSWRDIVDRNPVLHKLEPEVECLLINRVTKPHEYYVTPIDECYGLVGLIRSKWRGFSGGPEMWKAIGVFFTSLKARANGTESVPYVRA
ncbi:MAG TPA: DUF5947 family protein [Candidatus Acidoferrales bacterium]|nr:DUF5947 family protein [Candidatus Acidoferrales bacterium]